MFFKNRCNITAVLVAGLLGSKYGDGADRLWWG